MGNAIGICSNAQYDWAWSGTDYPARRPLLSCQAKPKGVVIFAHAITREPCMNRAKARRMAPASYATAPRMLSGA